MRRRVEYLLREAAVFTDNYCASEQATLGYTMAPACIEMFLQSVNLTVVCCQCEQV